MRYGFETKTSPTCSVPRWITKSWSGNKLVSTIQNCSKMAWTSLIWSVRWSDCLSCSEFFNFFGVRPVRYSDYSLELSFLDCSLGLSCSESELRTVRCSECSSCSLIFETRTIFCSECSVQTGRTVEHRTPAVRQTLDLIIFWPIKLFKWRNYFLKTHKQRGILWVEPVLWTRFRNLKQVERSDVWHCGRIFMRWLSPTVYSLSSWQYCKTCL